MTTKTKTTTKTTTKTKTTKIEIVKECPFCNYGIPGKDEPLTLDFWTDFVLISDVDQLMKFIFVACPNCKAQGPEARTEQDAIKLWNKARRLDNGIQK